MNTETLKKNLKEALVPENRKRELLQPLSAALATGVTIFAPSLGGAAYGFPVGFYSPAMVSCTALGCPPSQPAQLEFIGLVASFIIWYIVIGLVFLSYERWNE